MWIILIIVRYIIFTSVYVIKVFIRHIWRNDKKNSQIFNNINTCKHVINLGTYIFSIIDYGLLLFNKYVSRICLFVKCICWGMPWYYILCNLENLNVSKSINNRALLGQWDGQKMAKILLSSLTSWVRSPEVTCWKKRTNSHTPLTSTCMAIPTPPKHT